MLDHIELYVRDLKISRHFYDKLLSLLGFNIYQEWDLGFSYMKDSFYIVFVQTEEKYLSNNYHRKSAGLNHLAFKVNSLAEVDLSKKRCMKFQMNYIKIDILMQVVIIMLTSLKIQIE